jgi:UDP-2,3-diacylglucosamine pyrophosphatase LpxH
LERKTESVSTGRRLIPRANQLIVLGDAVKTLESKETRASEKIKVTHNSVFAAHRLAMPDDDSQRRHPAFCFSGKRIDEAAILQPE